MSGKVFIDTNIFVYMQRSDDQKKQKTSRDVIDLFDCVVSTQVINELCNIFTKKYPTPVKVLGSIIDAVTGSCEISVVSILTSQEALRLHSRYGYSYYDSLIVASALEFDCDYLFTEDMKDGQLIDDRLKIVNIFKCPDFLQDRLNESS
jgi:predicted nucleic acid-binding protein